MYKVTDLVKRARYSRTVIRHTSRMHYIIYSTILYVPFVLRQWNFQREHTRAAVRRIHPDLHDLSFVIRARSITVAVDDGKCARAIFDARFSINRERGYVARGEEGECPRAREPAWVDGFWHSESVSVQLEDRETGCILFLSPSRSLTLSCRPSLPQPLSIALSSLSLVRPSPPPSFSFSLSHSLSLIQRDYSREHPGGQSVRRQPPRRRDAPLSLPSLSRLSRRRPQHRDATTRSVSTIPSGETPSLISLRYVRATGIGAYSRDRKTEK